MSRNKKYPSLYCTYMRRSFGLSWLFSILGVFLINLADSWGDYSLGVRSCLFYFTMYNSSFGIFSKLSYVFCALPFATNYALESNTNMRQYTVFRLTGKKYAWSNLTVTALTGGLTLSLGMLIFIVFMRLQMPFFTDDYLDMIFTPDGYEFFLIRNNGIIYYAIMVFLEFLKGCTWAVVGLVFSSYIRINYIAVFSPLLISYTYIEMSKVLRIPDLWRIDRVFSILYPYPSTGISLLIAMGSAFIIILICGFIFEKKVNRSIENE